MLLPEVELIRRTFPWEEVPLELREVWTERGSYPIAVACSGGSDSVATLLLAWAWRPRGTPLHALHYHHGVREAADEDQNWVSALASQMGIGYASERRPSTATAVSETVLRADRLEFFYRSCAALGSSLLLTGHHLDDVLETFFIRLGRGSGAEGLSAPRPVQKHASGLLVGRPLLSLPREDIQERLRQLGVTWREDATNQEPITLRNVLRGSVVPAWKAAVGPAWAEGVRRSRNLLEESARSTGDLVGQWYAEVAPQESLPLAALPPDRARRREILRQWLQQNGLSTAPSAAAFDSLLEGLEKPAARFSWGGDRFLVIREGRLEIEATDKGEGFSIVEVPLPVVGEVFFPNGASLRLVSRLLNETDRARLADGKLDPAIECWLPFDEDPLSGDPSLRVRQWASGDRYHPLGGGGEQKLQDAFVNRKIPAPERMRRPVVIDARGNILWVPGLLPAERVRVTARTKRVLSLTYSSPFKDY